MKKRFSEAQVLGFFAGGGGRGRGQRSVSTTWILRDQRLLLTEQVRRHDRADAKRLKILEQENIRLKQ